MQPNSDNQMKKLNNAVKRKIFGSLNYKNLASMRSVSKNMKAIANDTGRNRYSEFTRLHDAAVRTVANAARARSAKTSAAMRHLNALRALNANMAVASDVVLAFSERGFSDGQIDRMRNRAIAARNSGPRMRALLEFVGLPELTDSEMEAALRIMSKTAFADLFRSASRAANAKSRANAAFESARSAERRGLRNLNAGGSVLGRRHPGVAPYARNVSRAIPSSVRARHGW